MAKATRKLVQVAPVYTITLELSQNEAETLFAITGKIGGAPETTRRRFTDSILKALREAGVQEVYAPMNRTLNAIWFETEAVNG